MRIKRIDIYERCRAIGMYVIEESATVRQTAKVFGVSKTTVHKDLTERLKTHDHQLYVGARKVLDVNKEQRAIRGGEATRQKFLQKKKITGV